MRRATVADVEVVALPPLRRGWCWMSVAELALPGRGSITDGPFGSKLKTEHYTESGPRVIRLQNIGDAEFVDAHAHVAPERFHALRKHEAISGDLVIAALGEVLPRACVVPATLGPAIVKADCVRVRLDPKHSSQYVNYALNWEGTRRRTSKIVHGVGRPRLNLGEVKSIQLPIPRPNEQRRIVAEIEKQFTRLDAGRAALERVQRNLKRYRAAVLKAACEGRLVPTEAELARAEGRTFEPASELLARILAERRATWSGRGKYKEPAPPDASNLPPPTFGWSWTTVEQLLASPLCNGVSVRGSVAPPGVRALRLSAMSASGFDYSDVRYLPIDDFQVDDLWIAAGDFFVSRGNGSLHLVGRGTLAQAPPARTIFPDTMIRVRLRPSVRDARWLPTIWSSRGIRDQVESMVKTTAGIYKIAQPQLERVIVPLPPLAEQHRIVAEVERRLSVVDKLEALVTVNLQRSTRLRQSILQRAFSGELVAGES